MEKCSIIKNEQDSGLEFDLPELHKTESVAVLSRDKIEELKSKGIAIKEGKWSKEEESILRRNFMDFSTNYDINDRYLLFGIGQGKRLKSTVQYLRSIHFYARLGKDLCDRTLRSIYIKGRQMFDPCRNKDAAEEKDISYICEKQEQVGNRWTTMGKNIGRSGKNCQAVYRWHGKDIQKGKWSDKEVKLLKRAIAKVSKTKVLSDTNQLQNISWKKVATFVSTRNFSQCRHYWAEHLAWDPNVKNKKRWDKSCFAKLLFMLKTNHYDKDEATLDWKTIQKSFVNVSPSYHFLKKRWGYLKSKVERGMSYRYVIDTLFDTYCNTLNKLTM